MANQDEQFHLPSQQPGEAPVEPPVAQTPVAQSEQPAHSAAPTQAEAMAFARAKLEAIYGEGEQPAPVEPVTQQAPAPETQNISQPINVPQMVTQPPVAAYPVTSSVMQIPGRQTEASRSEQIAAHAAAKTGPKRDLKGDIKREWIRPLIKSAVVTSIIFLIYNAPLVMGQIYYYITPANADTSPIIIDPATSSAVSADPKIVISKLNIDVPAVYDETSFDEAKIQAALQRGIVHYGNTALPGQLGNAVYMGHSSNSPWDPGRYKTAFSILRRLEIKDTFILHFEGKRYIYEVFDKKIIDPPDFSVVNQSVSEPIVTLITCDPPGANWKRLVIQARQISPNPKAAQPAGEQPKNLEGTLPGSPESLLDRFRNIF